MAGSVLRGEVLPGEPGAVALARVLDHERVRMLELERTVRTNEDPDVLHDFRVAVRRTRSVIALGKKELPDAVVDRWGPEWDWLATLTSDARDLDVLLDDLDAARSTVPDGIKAGLDELTEVVMARRRAAQHELRAALDSDRYHALTDGWGVAISDLASSPRTDDDVEHLARRLVKKGTKQVVGRATTITAESKPLAIHDLRKRIKRLRYVLELFGSALPKDKATAIVKETKRLQDELGRFQDNEVQRRIVAAMLHDSPGLSRDASVAARAVVERYDQRRRSARRSLAKQVRRFVKATA